MVLKSLISNNFHRLDVRTDIRNFMLVLDTRPTTKWVLIRQKKKKKEQSNQIWFQSGFQFLVSWSFCTLLTFVEAAALSAHLQMSFLLILFFSCYFLLILFFVILILIFFSFFFNHRKNLKMTWKRKSIQFALKYQLFYLSFVKIAMLLF